MIQSSNDLEMRFACVQCEAPSSNSAELMSLVLNDANAVAQEAAATSQWPAAIASAMADSLASRAARGNPSATLFFAALQMTVDTISICAAGDFRVHLIVDDLVTEVTRDHIMQSDSPQTVPDFAAMIPTRWLGGASLWSPECYTWRSPEACIVAVSSSQLHRYSTPPRTKRDLLEQSDLPMQLSQDRFEIWIERTRVGSAES